MTVNMDLYRGDSLRVELEIVTTSSAGEAAFNLAGYSPTVSLRWPRCQTLNLATTSLTVDSTAGTIEGTFTVTQTSTLPDSMQMYLILETTDGNKDTYPLGRVTVRSCESSTEICFNG
jgi:hypothetical protein